MFPLYLLLFTLDFVTSLILFSNGWATEKNPLLFPFIQAFGLVWGTFIGGLTILSICSTIYLNFSDTWFGSLFLTVLMALHCIGFYLGVQILIKYL